MYICEINFTMTNSDDVRKTVYLPLAVVAEINQLFARKGSPHGAVQEALTLGASLAIQSKRKKPSAKDLESPGSSIIGSGPVRLTLDPNKPSEEVDEILTKDIHLKAQENDFLSHERISGASQWETRWISILLRLLRSDFIYYKLAVTANLGMVEMAFEGRGTDDARQSALFSELLAFGSQLQDDEWEREIKAARDCRLAKKASGKGSRKTDKPPGDAGQGGKGARSR